MIIIRTPYRISFFGGGTDYPDWYKYNKGSVISTTINKCSFLVLRKLPDIFDYKYRIRYYDRQETKTVDEIEIPVIREAIKYMGYEEGLDITHHGDLPNRTGIGSSSSFTVSLLHGLATLKNEQITKRELAAKAIHLEQNILKEAVGSQDQVAAAFGGLNRIEFGGNTDFTCYPLHLNQEVLKELESWVQVFFTNKVRTASNIAEKKIENIRSKKVDLTKMNELTLAAEKILFSSDNFRLYEFAKMLDLQWELKKSMEDTITNPEINDIYQKARSAGALGGKLLGAGGGGFIMFMTPPSRQQYVIDDLKLKQVQFKFDYLGSQLVYHDYT